MKKNSLLTPSRIWTILVINLLLICSCVFFFIFEKENNARKISHYLTNGNKGYWKETYYDKENIGDYLYFDKDTSINFKKSDSNNSLIYSSDHEDIFKGVKEITKMISLNNYDMKVSGYEGYTFQIQNNNKFQILYKRSDTIITFFSFERVKKLPKIDTASSIKSKEEYFYQLRHRRTCGMGYHMRECRERERELERVKMRFTTKLIVLFLTIFLLVLAFYLSNKYGKIRSIRPQKHNQKDNNNTNDIF